MVGFGATDIHRIAGYLPELGPGAWLTLKISLLTMVLSTGFGLVLATGSRSNLWVVRALVRITSDVGRAIPQLVQVFVWYYTLPLIGIRLDAFTAGVLALSVAFAPYVGEIFRAGIEVVPETQWEAASVLGMRRWLTWRRVILPQALRTALPAWTGEFISIFKATSLLSFITINEVFGTATNLAAQNFQYFDLFIGVLIFYLAMGVPTALLLKFVEWRLHSDRVPRRSKTLTTEPALQGPMS